MGRVTIIYEDGTRFEDIRYMPPEGIEPQLETDGARGLMQRLYKLRRVEKHTAVETCKRIRERMRFLGSRACKIVRREVAKAHCKTGTAPYNKGDPFGRVRPLRVKCQIDGELLSERKVFLAVQWSHPAASQERGDTFHLWQQIWGRCFLRLQTLRETWAASAGSTGTCAPLTLVAMLVALNIFWTMWAVYRCCRNCAAWGSAFLTMAMVGMLFGRLGGGHGGRCLTEVVSYPDEPTRRAFSFLPPTRPWWGGLIYGCVLATGRMSPIGVPCSPRGWST